ncbi:hypothetical protein CJI97_003980 [Candidozyma auris]|nr:hypothetical protein CJI97_003980 [[Candida] auris]
MDAASIRVQASTIKDYGGRIVRVVGRVENIDFGSNTATISAGGPIEVITNANDPLETGKIYEIIGTVGASDFKINAYSVTQFSDNTNVELHSRLAALVPKVPELFY